MSNVTPQDPANDDQTVAQVQRKKATLESQLTAGIRGHEGKQLGVNLVALTLELGLPKRQDFAELARPSWKLEAPGVVGNVREMLSAPTSPGPLSWNLKSKAEYRLSSHCLTSWRLTFRI
jgi:hypothetical protein